MKKISLVVQELLKLFLVFLIVFVWIRYMVRSLTLAMLITLAISSTIYIILLLLSRKHKIKSSLKMKEKESAENMFLSLVFDEKRLDFFFKMASKRHQNVTKHKNYICIDYKLENVKTLLWFDGSFEGLTVPRLCDIYAKVKKENATKIVICCYETSDKNLPSFLRTFKEKIVLLDRYETYQRLYKSYDCFPQITRSYPKEKSVAFKDLLSYSFNKKRTKNYLFSALILILSGLFVRTTIYYCIIASLLVIFALICQFNSSFNPPKDDEII